MALSGLTVIEVQTGGSDTNGGGWVPGSAGADWSQQSSVKYGLTNGVANGTSTIATASASADMVGNLVYIAGGTGSITAGWYQILSQITGTSITVDRSTGLTAGTGVTLNIGGALATPGLASFLASVAGMTIYIKAGTYALTSATPNVSNGVISTLAAILIEGYSASRGDLGGPPLLQASGISTVTLFKVASGNSVVRNIAVDGASLTSTRGFDFNTGAYYKCLAQNCTNSGFTSTTGSPELFFCSATGCSTTGSAIAMSYFCYGCEAYANSVPGFGPGGGGHAAFCISYGNTGATTDGFALSVNSVLVSCTAYGNGRDGIRLSSSCLVVNPVCEGNGGAGITFAGSAGWVQSPATFSNTGGGISATGARQFLAGPIAGSGTFFVNAASGNFTLNNNVGGGALLRAAGFPGSYPRGLTHSLLDIGAAQSRVPWRGLHMDGGING